MKTRKKAWTFPGKSMGALIFIHKKEKSSQQEYHDLVDRDTRGVYTVDNSRYFKAKLSTGGAPRFRVRVAGSPHRMHSRTVYGYPHSVDMALCAGLGLVRELFSGPAGNLRIGESEINKEMTVSRPAGGTA